MTQTMLAKKARVTQATVSYIECGNYASPKVQQRISKAVGVSIGDMQ